MKYLAKNTNTNVIELVFDLPVNASPPLELIKVPNEQFRENMLNSIFTDINNYKPTPAWGKDENWWVSNGTDWIDTRDDDQIWNVVRSKRNTELMNSDWTQVNDSPLTSQESDLWKTYRTQLRNIPQNNSCPHDAEKALDDIIQNKPIQV